jgi:hypothetical protein
MRAMADVVVTVPKALWEIWIDEGDLPGEAYNGENEYHFFGRGRTPTIDPGERVYIVAHGLLRGYAPLVRLEMHTQIIDTFKPRTFTTAIYSHHDARLLHKPVPDWWWQGATYALVRHGGAVAVTIPQPIRGFQGWRYRWWNEDEETPFPDWMNAGVQMGGK